MGDKGELKAEFFIEKLKLSKHTEGGYFKEVYRSNESLEKLPQRFSGSRSIATSIYFLLNQADKSHFHRIKSDETWHFYSGSSVIIHMINADGIYSNVVVGNDIAMGEKFQFTIPQGLWFAAELVDKSTYGLFGCTVAPGFDFKDFELARNKELSKLCALQKDLINSFCLV